MKKDLMNLSTDDLRLILNQVDYDNVLDFESLALAIESHTTADEDTIHKDFCTFIYEDLGYANDSELINLTDEDVDDLHAFVIEL